MPEPVRGKSFVIVDVYHAGERTQADELLGGLRAPGPLNDAIETVSMPALSHVHMDAERPVPAVGDGLMLAALPAAALDTFVQLGSVPDLGLATMELRHLEGELGRARPRTARSRRCRRRYSLVAGGFTRRPPSWCWPCRSRSRLSSRHSRPGRRATCTSTSPTPRATRRASGPTTPTSVAGDQDSDRPAAGDQDSDRPAAAIKTAIDPLDVIRSNHPVTPLG